MDKPASTQTGGAIREIEVPWITAGLGWDGYTIAMTAATQPSIEDVILGAMPWIPKVNLHNPFLAAANGDDFLEALSSSCRRKNRQSYSCGRRFHSERTQ